MYDLLIFGIYLICVLTTFVYLVAWRRHRARRTETDELEGIIERLKKTRR